jgi:NADH-quinone oxidoreductase subunit C
MPLPDEKDPAETEAASSGVPETPGDPMAGAQGEDARTSVGKDSEQTPANAPTADDLTAREKLEQPAKTGAMATDPATSAEKPAEAAAPAPEGAQPEQAAAKATPPARPARPAREAEPKTAPRNPPPPGTIHEALVAALPGVQMQAYMVPSLPGEAVCIEVGRDDVPAVMQTCHDDERLDLTYLRCLSGVDHQDEGLEVVYHLWSFSKQHHLTVKTRVTYADASVPSVAAIYPAADWHERETRDMFGIDFPGHWNLVPLLLPDDMTDHFPLRKENPLQEIEEWQGENLREGAGEDEE